MRSRTGRRSDATGFVAAKRSFAYLVIIKSGLIKFDFPPIPQYYDANEVNAEMGDVIIVETDYGLDRGSLVSEIANLDFDSSQLPLKKMIRAANKEDTEKIKTLALEEEKAIQVCEEEIIKCNLDMKLITTRFSFDSAKATFYYTAEERVDFRKLLKQLASLLKMRIELRQVGVRDEARLFGGIGPCGRKLCCSTFLNSFEPVSIKMAREQNLPLNPLKLSGVCGRLFCCLKYEYDTYIYIKRFLPKIGEYYKIDDEKSGKVIEVNPMSATIKVEIGDNAVETVKLDIPYDNSTNLSNHCANPQCNENPFEKIF